MNLASIDWESLERMRAAFLGGTAGAQDYWRSESDLAAYDATFAQRIGWKWDYVLEELKARGWSPPAGDVLDWGCGSGVAGRAFLDHFGVKEVSALRVLDRSTLATAFAAKRARESFSGIKIVEEMQRADSGIGFQPAVLLISHVLTEMTQEQTTALVSAAASAECVIWVEPGTYETSLTLIAIRERLRAVFNVIAPCTHQERCGILSPENERHWCHHFGHVPSEASQDAHWSQFSRDLGIDLTTLPYSFLVLSRNGGALAPGATRIIGRPREAKGRMEILSCDSSGVRDLTLQKRDEPALFKSLQKGRAAAVQRWSVEDGKVRVPNNE